MVRAARSVEYAFGINACVLYVGPGFIEEAKRRGGASLRKMGAIT